VRIAEDGINLLPAASAGSDLKTQLTGSAMWLRR
jgi:hypothetical protein